MSHSNSIYVMEWKRDCLDILRQILYEVMRRQKPCTQHGIHEATNCKHIGDPSHHFNLLRCLKTLFLARTLFLKQNDSMLEILLLEFCIDYISCILSIYEAWDKGNPLFLQFRMIWIPRTNYALLKSFIWNWTTNHSLIIVRKPTSFSKSRISST